MTGCALSAEVTQTSGDSSYSDYLSTEMSVDASEKEFFVKFSFSASASYQSYHTSTYESNSIFVGERGACPTYQADVRFSTLAYMAVLQLNTTGCVQKKNSEPF